MSDDPLADLKRQIEAEVHQRPLSVEIHLFRDHIPRGEALFGRVVVTAGDNGAYIAVLAVALNGVPPSVGEALYDHPQCLGRHVEIPPGRTREFAFRVDIPEETPLGENYLILLPLPSARKSFRVDPEEPFGEIARSLAARSGQEITAWFNGRGGEGLFAQMKPARPDTSLLAVGLEMRSRDGVIEGALVVDEVCATFKEAVRAFFKPNRKRIPFRIPMDTSHEAVEQLHSLLLAASHFPRNLPLPAEPQSGDGRPDSLPRPATPEEPHERDLS